MKYVFACEDHKWHIELWDKSDPSKIQRIPYRCRSWRHEGECRLWKGAQDFTRIKDAVESRPTWLFATLTFAQGNWPDKEVLYRSGVDCWSKLRLRLRRKFGHIEYVQTWERHILGGAHVHLVMHNKQMCDLAYADIRMFRRHILKPQAVASGFGYITYVEPMRTNSEAGLAGYLVKLARELTGAGPKCQIPVDAPPHFRRIRASQHLLPAVNKSDLGGRLVASEMPDPEFTRDEWKGKMWSPKIYTGEGLEEVPNENWDADPC